MSSTRITVKSKHTHTKANNEIREKRKITITTHDTVNVAKEKDIYLGMSS